MKQSVLRFAAQLWAMLAVLLLFVAAALPAHADDGDMDEITHYTVTVDTRAMAPPISPMSWTGT